MQDMIERHQVCLPHRCCSRPFRGPETSPSNMMPEYLPGTIPRLLLYNNITQTPMHHQTSPESRKQYGEV